VAGTAAAAAVVEDEAASGRYCIRSDSDQDAPETGRIDFEDVKAGADKRAGRGDRLLDAVRSDDHDDNKNFYRRDAEAQRTATATAFTTKNTKDTKGKRNWGWELGWW
jgi:hypothetical protein